MAIFKCKMCGGELNIFEDSNVCECEYCGTTQTVPSADNEKKMNLFTRANRLRANNEFDKAAGVYESIVAEFPEEAEAYWGLVLCKYGIEYVDDPATAKKVPTCHRSSFDSVMDDSNFEMVMEYADSVARSVYRNEAKQIEEIRKGIIEVSSNEEPYDIFICYKETDEKGDRTVDSLIAQDTYDALTEKGYRVFFSRITLEDKLGQEYEPYIFAALNSAKVMLAFGTDYEHYNAVWVKNEWSRYLQLIAKGEKKTLIPCYKDIDPFDMPKEFAKLQAQDMGKVGAMQDLDRGVEKIVPLAKNSKIDENIQMTQSTTGPTVEPLLKRTFLFLEDGKWREADEYCEKVLDMDPENGQAYLCKLMVRLKIKNREKLGEQEQRFNSTDEYNKILRFADESLKSEIDGYDAKILRKLKEKENLRKEQEYTKALSLIQKANTEALVLDAIEKFKALRNYKDSTEKIEEAYKILGKIKEEEKTAKISKYKAALAYMEDAKIEEDYLLAYRYFNEAGDYKDAKERCRTCEEMLKSFADRVESGRQRALLLKDMFSSSPTTKKSLQLLLDTKGNVYTSDKNDERTINSSECDIVSTSIGWFHSVGLNKRGHAVSNGTNNYGQCNVLTWKDLIDIKSGGWHSVGLMIDGSVVAAGNNDYGQCNVNEWKSITKIGCGKNHTVGLKYDGTVVAAGTNINGQCDVDNWTDIKDIFVWYHQTVGLKNDGSVVVAGEHKVSSDEWVDIVDIVMGYDYILGLKSNGQVVAVGNNDYGQCNVQEWTNIVAIGAKNVHSAGLKADGTVVCTGHNKDGQCNVNNWKDIVSIYIDAFCTIGVREDGTVVLAGEPLSNEKNLYESVKLFDDIESLPSPAEKLKVHKERVNNEKTKREAEEKLRAERRAQGVCQHCGGEFKGMIGKKCVSCGKPKDY